MDEVDEGRERGNADGWMDGRTARSLDGKNDMGGWR